MENKAESRELDPLLQWSKWQLLDSILPTGGFAHSFGLEAAMQSRIVSKPEDLQTYIIHVLENTGSLLLPFVYSGTTSPDLQTWHQLDMILDATITNEVSRKASVSQGLALMRVSSSVFSEIPSLKLMRNVSLSNGNVCFHHAPIFGLVCGLLGLDSETSQRAYMFITMRDIISAATRLNLVGPLGAAVLQHQIAFVAEELLKKWKNRGAGEACQTSPLLDTGNFAEIEKTVNTSAKRTHGAPAFFTAYGAVVRSVLSTPIVNVTRTAKLGMGATVSSISYPILLYSGI